MSALSEKANEFIATLQQIDALKAQYDGFKAQFEALSTQLSQAHAHLDNTYSTIKDIAINGERQAATQPTPEQVV